MTTPARSPSSDNVQYIHGDDNCVAHSELLLQAYLEYIEARRYRDSEPAPAATETHSARM